MGDSNILPDSRTTANRGAMQSPQGFWVPIYCASCGCDGGKVPEENCTYVCWLCDSCFAKHGAATLGTIIPDQIFWEEVRQAQLAKYGRNLNEAETIASLADPESLESRLARSRAGLTPKAGS